MVLTSLLWVQRSDRSEVKPQLMTRVMILYWPIWPIAHLRYNERWESSVSEWMNGRRKQHSTQRKTSTCQFVQNKFHVICPGIEPRHDIWPLLMAGEFPKQKNTHTGLHKKCPLQLFNLNQIWNVSTHFSKLPNTKFHRNSINCSQVVTCIQMDRAILIGTLQGCAYA
jgi:hypothetical protein